MLGVCYYPEHWPRKRWPEDAREMAALGLRYVRIAEFAWSRIEPERDRFDWDWLDEAIDVLSGAGLAVVMCTPTATPPKWLIDARPEILAWDAQGRPRGFGSRRHYCFASPVWREETRRICEIIAARYGRHEAVAGWQLDNEYGCHDTTLSYAPHCRPAFQAWLADRYGTIGVLNTAWGNVFWSQEYNAFDEVELPNLTVTQPNPAHQLDYRRFASDMVAAYNRLQAEIVRRHSPGRFVAHNSMGFFTDYDHFAVAADLDVFAWDSYPLGFTNQRAGLSDAERVRYARTGHPDIAALHHDLYRGLGRDRWWVMEQQPGPVNWADENPAPADGMVRLWTWEALAHGAEVVSYFRWRQAPFAQEQMHAGLNRPDFVADTGAKEAQRVANELTALGGPLPKSSPGHVAIMFDYEAAWVTRIQPHARDFDYLALVRLFYTALRRLGLDVDIVGPAAPLHDYALVAVPTMPILSEDTAAHLKSAAGALVLGPRTGSKTESFGVPTALPPGPAQSLIDLKVTRVESLPGGLVEAMDCKGRRYEVRLWRERIDSPLAPLARFADGTGAAYRHGATTYIGFWPDEAFLIDMFESLLADHGFATLRLSEDVRLRRRGNLHFALNYGGTAIEAPAGRGAQFLVGERTLGAHDLAIWREVSR